MPTARPRVMVTESDALAHALNEAGARWPGLPRSELLVRLALAGAEATRATQDELITRRTAAVDALAGTCTGMYGPGYLEQLRSEWPE